MAVMMMMVVMTGMIMPGPVDHEAAGEPGKQYYCNDNIF